MSAMNPRTMKLGQLEELKQKEYKLRVQIDTVVKTMVNSFEPLDRDMKYVDGIEARKLEIYMYDIKKKVQELKGVLQEKSDLEKELGEE